MVVGQAARILPGDAGHRQQRNGGCRIIHREVSPPSWEVSAEP
jgi:hypothetical protein